MMSHEAESVWDLRLKANSCLYTPILFTSHIEWCDKQGVYLFFNFSLEKVYNVFVFKLWHYRMCGIYTNT